GVQTCALPICSLSTTYVSTILIIGVVVPDTMTTSSRSGLVLCTANWVSAPPTTTMAFGVTPSSCATSGRMVPNTSPADFRGGNNEDDSLKTLQSVSDHSPALTSYRSVSDACECS